MCKAERDLELVGKELKGRGNDESDVTHAVVVKKIYLFIKLFKCTNTECTVLGWNIELKYVGIFLLKN